MSMSESFARELEALINAHSVENGSNTPDFILAQYLMGCLAVWNAGIQRREQWYGRAPALPASVPLGDLSASPPPVPPAAPTIPDPAAPGGF
jgi:hypothetical protein